MDLKIHSCNLLSEDDVKDSVEDSVAVEAALKGFISGAACSNRGQSNAMTMGCQT